MIFSENNTKEISYYTFKLHILSCFAVKSHAFQSPEKVLTIERQLQKLSGNCKGTLAPLAS
ncbi:hypothetical protein NIES4103_12000 [Nostoc sp. NIES-4103]|nr:hypothetical protein NIES4103_12000 [Nostoc sp. NIES-4103]